MRWWWKVGEERTSIANIGSNVGEHSVGLDRTDLSEWVSESVKLYAERRGQQMGSLATQLMN